MNKPLSAKEKVPLKQRRHNTLVYLRQHWQLYLIFMLPAFVLTIIFRYVPMGGVAIAAARDREGGSGYRPMFE